MRARCHRRSHSPTSRTSSSSARASHAATRSSHQLAKIDLARRSCAGIRAREDEQRLDESREALDLRERALEVRPSRFGKVALEVLEPQPQRRQRRPQLVRCVGDELALRAEQLLQPADGLVEHRGERAHLGRALVLGRARGEIAVPDRGGGLLEVSKRTDHERREPYADERGERQDDRSDCEQDQPVPA